MQSFLPGFSFVPQARESLCRQKSAGRFEWKSKRQIHPCLPKCLAISAVDCSVLLHVIWHIEHTAGDDQEMQIRKVGLLCVNV